MKTAAFISLMAALAMVPDTLRAQDNTEIQVYGSDLVETGHTMIELHSNYTADGIVDTVDGVLPTHHAVHETLEITHGFAPVFEVGFYMFTSARSGDGFQWTGFHVRPRFRIPESWHWPVGVSLSQEIGYTRRAFSTETWTWEIRPIIDQTIGRFYWSFNPVLEVSLKGEAAGTAPEFAPNAKVSVAAAKWVQVGLEYYGGFGPISGFLPTQEQTQQLFPVVDLFLAPNLEINAGVGFGLTDGTDVPIAKLILGYRLGR